MKTAEPTIIRAGIDPSKAKLDIAVHGRSAELCVSNDEAGRKVAAAHFKRNGVTRVGIEASGGQERGFARYLQKAGFSAIVMQPVQVKAFAKLRLKRAKSDGIDAVLLAQAREPKFLVSLFSKSDRLLPPRPNCCLSRNNRRQKGGG